MTSLALERREPAGGLAGIWTGPGRHVAWMLVGYFSYALCQWAMLVVLARTGDAEMVGRFALALAVTAPVLLFANLQIREILVTDARGEHRFGDYLGLRLATTGLALLVVTGITLAAGYRGEIAIVVLLVAVAKATEAVADVGHGLLQRQGLVDRIACSMMLRGALSLVALGVGVLWTGHLAWGVLALAVAWTLVLVGYDLPAVADAWAREGCRGEGVRAKGPGDRLIALARSGLPLGIVAMLMSIGANAPRYFIARYAGEHDLGIFAALACLMVAVTTVASAIDQVISPRLARHYTAGRLDAVRGLLWRSIGACAAVGGLGVAVVLVAGRPLVSLLYGPEYVEHSTVLTGVMVTAALSGLSWPLNSALVALRRLYSQAAVNALNLVLLLALCWLLVPRHGMTGAVVAMSVSAAALVVVRATLIEQHLRAASARWGAGR